ncbi:MAG TPA: MobF family relaxase [Acidimicrobiales bacterium]|nr:MobF family relaxase [Acidimicrobiales bacterium]
MISIRRVSLGGGFRYLMESVAAGDQGSRPADGLAAYYTATGTPPGRFLGTGLADLDGDRGVEKGSEVSEEHLRRMLGEMCDPISGDPVGQTPILSDKRVPVAGFDLTFSPTKSVSVAWALADPEAKAVIYDCHRRAIDFVLSYAEREVFRSRSGSQGAIEEDVCGVVAAAFTHWDSRAGDPQLHDHVVVWNRARSTSDGRWRTLDSRGLFKASVMLSELHQGVLSDLLTEKLGVGWEGRTRRHSDHRRWEITGVPETLMAEFSKRSEQVEQRTAELVTAFRTAYRRRPTTVETMRLAQQATLETRPAKAHHSLADMTAGWRTRADSHLGSAEQQRAWVTGLAGRNDLPLLRSDDLSEAILTDAARAAREAVSSRRATFTRHNVVAEALRILHGVRFASPAERVATAERITALALDGSVLLNPPNPAATPAEYLRADGTSRLHPKSHNIYTTQKILDAEGRLLDAGRRIDGPWVSRQTVTQIADRNLPGTDRHLSVDQALAVEQIATSGRPLDVLVGPAGTGKSTTMAALRAAWQAQHGPGSVIGLAPSAAAAEALADELHTATENTAKWLTEYRRVPELVARRQRLAATRAAHTSTGHAAPRTLRQQLADLDAQIETRRPHAGQLLIVDEASLAGTLALDELVTAANSAGAKVLLVGDPAQLSAVEAGGAFSLVASDRGDSVPHLEQVRRFTNAWEKAASLDLRLGRTEAIDAYHSHGRIIGGHREQLLEALYQAWRTDVEASRSSLMIASDTATVAELNRRARADRVNTGEATREGVDIASGQTAGVGDQVVSRQNDRRLTTRGGWVKNGDRWNVTTIHPDHSITVRRIDGSGEARLPADYVSDHVELAYATTAHQAQGRTVDTSHALISSSATHEVLYVCATRGRYANRLYVDTSFDPDPETGHHITSSATTAHQALANVLANEGADLSAHAVIRRTSAEAKPGMPVATLPPNHNDPSTTRAPTVSPGL